MIEIQQHYGIPVFTDVEYDAMRKEKCLCLRCKNFIPSKPELNCKIAALLYAVCRQTNIAAGVSRCPVYMARPTAMAPDIAHECEGCGTPQEEPRTCPRCGSSDFDYDWGSEGHQCSACGFYDGYK